MGTDLGYTDLGPHGTVVDEPPNSGSLPSADDKEEGAGTTAEDDPGARSATAHEVALDPPPPRRGRIHTNEEGVRRTATEKGDESTAKKEGVRTTSTKEKPISAATKQEMARSAATEKARSATTKEDKAGSATTVEERLDLLPRSRRRPDPPLWWRRQPDLPPQRWR